MESARRIALVTSIATLALLSVGCTDSSDPEPTSQSSNSTPTNTATTTETPEPTSTATPTPAGSLLPIYFVTDTSRGPRLVREFQRGEGNDALLEAALVVDGGSSVDSDYRTLWPGQTISAVAVSNDQITVSLNADAFTEAPDGMTRREARLAIQQMVYTLQGAHKARVPVTFTREGGHARLFGIDVSTPVKAASALKTLNLINITEPAEGAVLPAGPFTVTGVSNSFEASGPCELRQDGAVVATMPYQAEGWVEDKLFPFTATFTKVSAGDYELVCSTDDPTGGTEGFGPMSDTKRFTIR